MTLSHGFRQLANVVENLEANGLEVLGVATTDDDPSERLTVDLTVTVPIEPTESATHTPLSDEEAENASVASDSGPSGGEQPAAEVRERVLDPLSVRTDATNGATVVEMTDVASTEEEVGQSDDGTDADGEVDVVDCPIGDCDATFESDHGMKIHRTKVHGDEDAGADGGGPAYRDPERLREVYAACDSFTEMREALDTDVSTQTVRRQMIAHDIYEPGESETGSNTGEDEVDDSSTEAAENEGDEDDAGDDITDDADTGDDDGDSEGAENESELDAMELPEGVTVADLKCGVSSAQTLYDVQQCFDLDRDEAMQLLETYDLLEVVHGRVSNRDVRKQVGEDEITRRILEHASITQPSQA